MKHLWTGTKYDPYYDYIKWVESQNIPVKRTGTVIGVLFTNPPELIYEEDIKRVIEIKEQEAK